MGDDLGSDAGGTHVFDTREADVAEFHHGGRRDEAEGGIGWGGVGRDEVEFRDGDEGSLWGDCRGHGDVVGVLR